MNVLEMYITVCRYYTLLCNAVLSSPGIRTTPSKILCKGVRTVSSVRYMYKAILYESRITYSDMHCASRTCGLKSTET